MNFNKLPKSFYIKNNILEISQNLLGKILQTNFNNKITSGIIVETEAYAGALDKGSHAYKNKKTFRNKPMFDEGGICYVYLCYGIYYLFNIVTNKKEIPHAILIRAIEPFKGKKLMTERRKFKNFNFKLTNGPGKLSIALGINANHNGESLFSNNIAIFDYQCIKKSDIVSTSRIGIDYAGKDANLPYRFYIKDNCWVSKK